jgi:hypothetical protein
MAELSCWEGSRASVCPIVSPRYDTGRPQANEKECNLPLAIAGTGYGLIGILVIILLVVMIVYFVRRA